MTDPFSSFSVKAMLLLVDCKYCVLESRKKEENGYLLRNEDGYAESQKEDGDIQRSEEQLVTEIKYRIPKKTMSVSYICVNLISNNQNIFFLML